MQTSIAARNRIDKVTHTMHIYMPRGYSFGFFEIGSAWTGHDWHGHSVYQLFHMPTPLAEDGCLLQFLSPATERSFFLLPFFGKPRVNRAGRPAVLDVHCPPVSRHHPDVIANRGRPAMLNTPAIRTSRRPGLLREAQGPDPGCAKPMEPMIQRLG